MATKVTISKVLLVVAVGAALAVGTALVGGGPAGSLPGASAAWGAGPVATAGAGPAAASGADLAATCAACHGTDGRPADPAIPALAGLPREALLGRMLELRGEAHRGSLMHQLALGYTEEEIQRVADYLSSLAPAEEGR